jgi:hypothetical protein
MSRPADLHISFGSTLNTFSERWVLTARVVFAII